MPESPFKWEKTFAFRFHDETVTKVVSGRCVQRKCLFSNHIHQYYKSLFSTCATEMAWQYTTFEKQRNFKGSTSFYSLILATTRMFPSFCIVKQLPETMMIFTTWDSSVMHQLVANTLRNIAKHSPELDHITVVLVCFVVQNISKEIIRCVRRKITQKQWSS